MQCVRTVDHPLWKHGSSLGRVAESDCPVLDPSRAFFADEGVGQAVGLIAESVAQSDEAITSFAQEIEEFADVVGFELIRVQQKNLLWLIADGLFRKLLEVGEDGVAVGEIAVDQLLLERGVAALPGVVVEASVHPVPAVESYGSDAIAARGEKGFGLAAGLKVAAGIEERMPEISERHFVLGQEQADHALALDHVVFPCLQAGLI